MIAVVQGGHESEAEVSRMTSKAFQAALDKMGLTYKVVEYDEGFRHNIESLKPEVCLLALHGKYSEDGVVQSLLEKINIPYTGSGAEASALAFNKVKSLEEARRIGIPVLPHFSYQEGELPNEKERLEISSWKDGFVVKPSESGSSRGVTLCDRLEDLEPALAESFKWDSTSLIEKRLRGRELTVSIFENQAFELIEIRPKTGFYDMKNKYTKGATDYLIPAPVGRDLKESCQKHALKIYQNFKLSTYCRVDFLVTNDESECYFMEVNTLPGCTETSLLPKALAEKGIAFTSLVESLLRDAKLKS